MKERKDSESEVEEVVSTRKPTLESSLRMSRAREIGLLIPKREFLPTQPLAIAIVLLITLRVRQRTE